MTTFRGCLQRNLNGCFDEQFYRSNDIIADLSRRPARSSAASLNRDTKKERSFDRPTGLIYHIPFHLARTFFLLVRISLFSITLAIYIHVFSQLELFPMKCYYIARKGDTNEGIKQTAWCTSARASEPGSPSAGTRFSQKRNEKWSSQPRRRQ